MLMVLGTLCSASAPGPDVAAEAVATAAGGSASTERLYLSGTGRNDPKPWRFSVSEGRRAGEAASLGVPSHWELHGFGHQNYGHDEDKVREQGRYATDFELPESWRGRRIDLVFEGVMTDTTALVNGRSVGPTHRGSFYRFRYPVETLLRFGDTNTLEVTVDEHSADPSVNRAERDADYWVFGGIYRPVYLESRPSESIRRLAVDARHDGALAVHVELEGLGAAATLEARVEDSRGRPVGAPHILELGPGRESVVVRTKSPGVEPWTAETPNLYQLRLDLRRGARRLHQVSRRIGFRTVELRPGEGLFINDRRVRLRGVNRHAFWPTSGRTLDADLDRRDVELMKQLNLNTVRSSHYPPDPSFLEACDTLGLYVVNELAGWHDAYGTEVGKQLVREMVERDVNHPSVILWANGNEGGWNTDLDDLFATHDPSRRPVFHPDANFRGIEAKHYPTWEELEERLDPDSWLNRWRSLWGPLPLVMPTEALHGLYDGGSGAGLARYWERIRASPRGGGLFLWSFTDESVARVGADGGPAHRGPKHRNLDSDGNHAPDGVLGPFRETTGSFYAVREVFSPIRIEASAEDVRQRRLRIENRYDHLDLETHRLRWAWLDLPSILDRGPAKDGPRRLDHGTVALPGIAPGGRLEHTLDIPTPPETADALRLTAIGPTTHGMAPEIMTWVLPIDDPRRVHQDLGESPPGSSVVQVEETGGRLSLISGDTVVEIDPTTGWLTTLRRGRQTFGLARGPRPGRGPTPRVLDYRVQHEGPARRFEAELEGGLDHIHWTLFPNGWLRLELGYNADPAQPYHGIRFDYPRELVIGLRWLGDGPTRQWGNRRQGGTLGTWLLDAHRTTAPHRADGPKLAGYYGDVAWAELQTLEGTLELALEPGALELGWLTPRFPDDARGARAEVPDGGLHLLGKLPEIGTKFYGPEELAPLPETGNVSVSGTLWLRFVPR